MTCRLPRTPRTGKAITHRVGSLIFGDLAPAFDWGLPGKSNPRAGAEPQLDAWLSRLLPDPSTVSFSVILTDAHGTIQTTSLKLSELHLSALDILQLADASSEPAASELELRIQDAVPGAATAVSAKIQYSLPSGSTAMSVPELLVCARAIRDLIGGARALAPADLFEPERQLSVDEQDLGVRAQAALGDASALVAALSDANASAVTRQAQLRLASYYGLDVFPLDENPLTQAPAAAVALQKRIDQAAAAAKPVEQLQALFGRGFLVLPRFSFRSQQGQADAAILQAALAASESLLDPRDPLARERWMQQLSHVRPGCGRYDDAWSASELLGARRPELTLGQLPPLSPAPGPNDPPDRWLALDFATASDRIPASGRVALAVELLRDGADSYDPALEHCGLLFDEWVERIPNSEETTGLAFHYEEPASRAPQALLLAVCPDERPEWDDEALQAVLGETLDLARIRTVDLDSVQLVGQLLPALYLPFNPSGEAVSVAQVIFK